MAEVCARDHLIALCLLKDKCLTAVLTSCVRRRPRVSQGGHRDKRVKTSALPSDGIDEPLMRKCDQLVKSLMKRSQGVHFSRPVEWKKMGLTDYPKLIKDPMDLGTVAERVGKSYYTRLEQFANDIRLVWVRLSLCPLHPALPPPRVPPHLPVGCAPPPPYPMGCGLAPLPHAFACLARSLTEKRLHLQRPRLAVLQGGQDALRRVREAVRAQMRPSSPRPLLGSRAGALV